MHRELKLPQLSHSLESLIVGREQGHIAIIECWFRRARKLDIADMQCTYATGIILLNPFLSIFETFAMPHSVLMIVAFLAQLGVCALLYSTNNKSSWQLYWLNPVTILSTMASPIPSIHHFLLTALWVSPLHRPHGFLTVTLFLSYLWLVSTHLPYICLLPSLLAIHSSGAPFVFHDSLPVQAFIVAVTVIIAASLSLLFEQESQKHHFKSPVIQQISGTLSFGWDGFSLGTSRAGVSYSPGAGVQWYMRAQVFAQFEQYYSLLTFAQPFLFAIPIYLRFAKSQPQLALHMTVALVLFFSSKVCYADVLFVVVTLSMHREVIKRMKFLPWVAVGMIMPGVVSPILLHLWREMGTGNANFLFFQGLAMWFFGALGILEFISTAVDIKNQEIRDAA